MPPEAPDGTAGTATTPPRSSLPSPGSEEADSGRRESARAASSQARWIYAPKTPGTSSGTQIVAVGIYVALGDSISIDDYTGVCGGGAASQLARKLDLDLVDLTLDGNTTQGVLADLVRAPAAADVVTLTAGGNDLLGGDDLLGGVLPRAILRRLHQIAERTQPLGARVVINTTYDPSDGNNDVGRRELGLSRLATIELRRRLNAVNRGIAQLAADRVFLHADLERRLNGHRHA